MTNVSIKKILDARERTVILLLLSMILIFTVLDVYEDLVEGATLWHVIPEVLIILSTSLTATYLYYKIASIKRHRLEQIKVEVEIASLEQEELKQRIGNLKAGIVEAISGQLKEWKLSQAQQEIAFLLIKGFSSQEIADLRETSEQTIRQQASIIYKKSGLSGRAQLSAYFIEDLLSPQ